MKKGPVTIKDLAAELNISPSTVSRALANNPLVKLSTRREVQRLAKEQNYQPNFTALSLKSSKTKTLGIIIPDIVHEFFGLVIRGIEDFAYNKGYNVIICSTHEMYQREVMVTKALLNGRVDGIMACISKESQNYDHFKEIVSRNIPLVFFDCICEEIDSHRVIIDDSHAGGEVAKHLIKTGSKKPAFLGGPKNLSIIKDRLAGFKSTFESAGIVIPDSNVIHCDSGNFEDGREAARNFNLDELDSLFATTDMLAIGAIKTFKESGVRIPEDVSVIGFSNWSVSEIYEPALTTVNQPGYEMGFKSAELLIQQIEGDESKPFETHILPTSLEARESSGSSDS